MVRNTNEEIIKFLKTFKKNVNQVFKVEKIILFGSRARNDHLLSSDVDLILISKDFKKLEFVKFFWDFCFVS